MNNHKSESRLTVGPTDDSYRSSLGLSICALELEGGMVRLIFDDVNSARKDGDRMWKHRCFVTSFELTHSDFDSCTLSEQDLARIGKEVLTRLSARAETRRKLRERC